MLLFSDPVILMSAFQIRDRRPDVTEHLLDKEAPDENEGYGIKGLQHNFQAASIRQNEDDPCKTSKEKEITFRNRNDGNDA